MEFDLEEYTMQMTDAESAAIGVSNNPQTWSYHYRQALFRMVRSKLDMLENTDVAALQSESLRDQILHDRAVHAPVLRTMMAELVPHVEDAGVARGAEEFLRELD